MDGMKYRVAHQDLTHRLIIYFKSAAKFPQEIKATDNIGRQLDNKTREMASEIEIPIDTTAGQF